VSQYGTLKDSDYYTIICEERILEGEKRLSQKQKFSQIFSEDLPELGSDEEYEVEIEYVEETDEETDGEGLREEKKAEEEKEKKNDKKKRPILMTNFPPS